MTPLLIPGYKSLAAEVDDLRSRGYRIEAIEVSWFTAHLLVDAREIELKSVDQDVTAEINIFEIPLRINEDVPVGRYRIVTEEQVDYVLREDFQR